MSCEREDVRISAALGACGGCLARGEPRANESARAAHERSRCRFGLPPSPPQGGRARCTLCANRCAVAEGERGFCGLRTCREGRLLELAGGAEAGLLEWYHDPLPTNCVASWWCPAGTGAGYPRWAVSPGPEFGWKNLAVFYESCTFDCLFCQNWHFRAASPVRGRTASAEELAGAVDERTSCICYFGGDPSSQMAHALAASQIARERTRGRVLRICWETNGCMSRRDLERALEASLESGGCLKFDLKCWSEPLHVALTGASNRPVLANFEFAAGWTRRRPELPLLVASTLLVPGYVGTEEVGALARFVASLDPAIPYSLLAFHPDFEMTDLPATSRVEADSAMAASLAAGLRNVRLGNVHLLT